MECNHETLRPDASVGWRHRETRFDQLGTFLVVVDTVLIQAVFQRELHYVNYALN